MSSMLKQGKIKSMRSVKWFCKKQRIRLGHVLGTALFIQNPYLNCCEFRVCKACRIKPVVYLKNEMANHHVAPLLKSESSLTFVARVWFVFFVQPRWDLELWSSWRRSPMDIYLLCWPLDSCVTASTSQKTRPLDLCLTVTPCTLFVKLIAES